MIEHLAEEQLILHYYGEDDGGAVVHMAGCSECRDAYRRLQLVLNAVADPVPGRPPEYEAQVWQRLAPHVTGRRRLDWLNPKRWAAPLAIAAVVVIAFLAGRYSPAPGPAGNAPVVKERVLLIAVGDHLGRSQTVLAEITNMRPGGRTDIGAERALARNWVGAHPLYRQTARASGDTQIVGVLDDLERVLLEIAHSPEAPAPAELDALRQRIEAEGLLFTVRVLGTRLRAPETAALRPAAATRM
jgi:hypothetical protein